MSRRERTWPAVRRPWRSKCLQRPSARMILLPRYQAGLRDDIRRDRRSIAALTEFTAQHPRTCQPLVASISPGSQGKSNRPLRSLVVARVLVTSRMLPRNALLTCCHRVTYGRLILDLQYCNKYAPPHKLLFARTLSRPLSSRKTIRVIHGKTTLGHNYVL
jgi:hypothetical protein